MAGGANQGPVTGAAAAPGSLGNKGGAPGGQPPLGILMQGPAGGQTAAGQPAPRAPGLEQAIMQRRMAQQQAAGQPPLGIMASLAGGMPPQGQGQAGGGKGGAAGGGGKGGR